MPSVDNRKIALNTLALYVRMGIYTLISLYTSRVIINALGVQDYGLYNLVAGVIGMMSFLNASMSGATSRFLSFEHGIGNTNKLRLTFSNALIIHLCIAGILIIVAETLGLWFLNNKVNIEPGKLGVANFVYQFAIISACLGIIQVPYNASLIANEKFSVFAYVEIINVVSKLLVAFSIFIIPKHKLEVYSLLNFLVTIIITLVYIAYSNKKFKECRFIFKIDKSVLKPMLSFSGWDFFGNMSVTLNFQGCGIVMNMFYGTVINAAYGIANTVQGTLKGLSVNVISASRPQIIKQYAMGDIPQMGRLVTNASKIALVLYLCMALPLYLEADFVIRLWLGIVPEYTVFLLKVILISTLFNVANNVLNIPIHATGRMKYFSFATGSFYILVPIILYFLLHVGVSVYHAFYVVVFTNMTTLLITILFVRFLVPGLGLRMLILYGYLPLLPLIIIYEIVCDFFLTNHGDWSRLLLSVLFSILLVGVFAAFYCLNKDQRLRFVCGAKQRLHL